MDYNDIFEAYYTLYRAEAEVPNSEDDEYAIGIPLANEAINRWSSYDNTMWKELFTTAQEDGDGDLVLSLGETDYDAPSDMKAAGGFIRVYDDSNATVARIKIIEPQEAQFLSDSRQAAYFIGNPNSGFTLKLNVAPDAALAGKNIDYVFYKKADKIEIGEDSPEMSDPYFIVHRMLANRFRSSRNPYYTSAKSDAEDALRMMQLQNNSGNWADPWSLTDHSGTQWGG